MAGLTADNVEELEILTYDGRRLIVGIADEDEHARIIAGRRHRRNLQPPKGTA